MKIYSEVLPGLNINELLFFLFPFPILIKIIFFTPPKQFLQLDIFAFVLFLPIIIHAWHSDWTTKVKHLHFSGTHPAILILNLYEV